MKVNEALRLDFSDGRDSLTSLDAINKALRELGSQITELDLSNTPEEIQILLEKPKVTPEESLQIQAHFLMSRERLLEIIRAAGREPQVSGGGAMSTHISPYEYDYPQLYVAEADADYSRFERFHINEAEDGTGVDEILQMLCGKGIEAHFLKPDGTVLTLQIACPAPDYGWVLTYDGVRPHIATLSSATPGTKLLVQVIGAPRWIMQYLDEMP